MTEELNLEGKPISLGGGRELLRWIEAGGPVDRSLPLLHLRLRWAAYWFERFSELTGNRCSAMSLPNRLVFVLGLWRSGSTVLHQELAEATGWATPRTWQCFNPADFLLKPLPVDRQASRPMDVGMIGTFTPQEDEFAALLLGEDSVYRGFIDPRRLDALTELLVQWKQFQPVSQPPLSPRWEIFLKAVSSSKPGPMLIKSPNHTFRLPWLARRFPDAQFIWLTRPHDDLMQSNHRMWSAMIRRYSLWRGIPSVLDHFLAVAVRNHDELLEYARATFADRLTVVRFDEVMNGRPQVVRRLIGALGYESQIVHGS
jgi:hypothetical protein